MNKALWILGGLVLAAALFGAFSYLHTHQAPSAPAQQDTRSGNAAVGANGASSVITYTDAGFSPSPLTVAVGTTVTWTNQSSRTLWIEGSGAKSDCVNTAHLTLNECAAIAKGGSYSYTFTASGTHTYVNHERPADTGTITVTSAGAAGPINPKAVPQ